MNKATQRRRFKQLVDFLDTLPADKFDIKYWVKEFDPTTNCGTVCCSIGWLPKIDPKSGNGMLRCGLA